MRAPEQSCIECGQPINTIATIDQSEINDPTGSLCVCLKCGGIQVIGEGLKLRALSDRERRELAGDRDRMDELREAAAISRSVHFARVMRAAEVN